MVIVIVDGVLAVVEVIGFVVVETPGLVLGVVVLVVS